MNADELLNELSETLSTSFHKLSINEQMAFAAVEIRFQDLAATERFLDNAIMNAHQELREIQALIGRK